MRRDKDFSYLLIDKSKHGKPIDNKYKTYLSGVYLDMITEFFKIFGKTESQEKESKIMIKIMKLNISYAKSGEIFTLNSINALKQKLDFMNSNKEEREKRIDPIKEIGKVSKEMGFPIDPKKISTLQYYTFLHSING